MEAGERHDLSSAGHAAALDDVGDSANLCVDALVARHHEHTGRGADVDRQRHGHAGEDDGVVQWDKQVLRHDSRSHSFS